MNARTLLGSIFLIVLTAGSALAVDYVTIANGNWNSAGTWSGGAIPPSTLTSGNSIQIRHTVTYDLPGPIINHGTIRIEPVGGTLARLLVPTNINVENYATSPQGFYIKNASFLQCRFAGPSLCSGNNGEPYVGTAPQAPKLSGTFKNLGGYVEVINADVEVAQDWTSENGGIRVMKYSCLRTGQNYSISGASSFDTLEGVNISIGWHTSGNFDLSDGTIHFISAKIQLAGTSGNFKLNSGKAFGDIDYITLKNHKTNPTPPPAGPPAGSIGSGEIFASSSLVTSGTSAGGVPVVGLVLDAYCVSPATQYKPNGKFIGSQILNCGLNFSTDDCQAIVITAGGATIEGRVTTADGLPIRNATIVISGGEMVEPIVARTNPFGWYRFDDITVGHAYLMTVRAKAYTFSEPTRVVRVNDNVSGFDFIAIGDSTRGEPTRKPR